MAEQIPLDALGFQLENLKEFILYNSNLIGGLDEKVKMLVDDLDLMKAFVIEYTRIDTDNNAVLQTLTDDVRNVVYGAEDAIEEYIVCRTLQQRRGIGSRALHLSGYVSDLKEIGKRIQDVSAKLRIFLQERAPLGLDALRIIDAANKGEKKKKKAPVVMEDSVVGFEDEAKAVIELLMSGESQQLEIISIIGMGGLGKTTLAKKVLNDPKVEYEFLLRVFVNVSQEYERREVFISILSALNCQITPDMPDNEIVEEIRKALGTRKYLIVLDDVWTETVWDDLKVAFPNNKKGSRVLITSRHKRVASHADPSSKNLHQLRFMNGVESRELLRRKVFGENPCPSELLRYELRILDKCGGLPLAIVVVAGILLNQQERADVWEQVAESVGDYVAQNESQLNDVIKLSFNHLPYNKKACFLYLGVFGENPEIPVWKLLWLWIAEGFIQKNGYMTREDIAEDYLEDLVDMSLVMVGRRRSNGQIKTCRIHDSLRSFCKKEALKQKLFTEIKWLDQSTSLAEGPALQSDRRICVNSNVKDYVTSKLAGHRVRSFLTFAKEEISVPPVHVSSIPKAFKLVRVLDVKPLKFTRLPIELMDLVLLKYIAMSCDFKTIPKQFSNLRNLQTIIIHTTARTLEIRADISKLALLRHLLTNASTSLEKGTVPSVVNANLQTLCTISPESCTAEVFERYPKLKKLGIRGKLATVILANGESALFDTLVKLGFLENLKLINDDSDFPLHVLPAETNFPRNLRRLTLKNTFLDWSQISTLGKLQKLEVLKLKETAFDGESWDTEDGGFRSLRVLHIGHTQKLESWNANASHFPMLTCLYLRHCANLKAIPSGFADIPSLQTIDLYHCTKLSVVVSAQKIQLVKLQQARQKNDTTWQFKLVVDPPDQ